MRRRSKLWCSRSALSCRHIFVVAFALCLLPWLIDCGARGQMPAKYGRQHLMVAFATHSVDSVLIAASRPWRRGVRTHIVVDPTVCISKLQEEGAAFQETYSVVPDFYDYPHTVRQAFVPVNAYASAVKAASFQWLLLGDDDTVFVIPAVLEMLNNLQLDPREPALLSDFLRVCPETCGGELGRCRCGSHPVDPRCQPCPAGQAVCGCLLAPGCTVRNREAAKKNCSFDATFYGGAGVVMSRGLLQQLANVSHVSYFAELLTMMHDMPYSDVYMSDISRRLGHGITSTGATPPPPPPSLAPDPPPAAAAPPAESPPPPPRPDPRAPFGLGPGGPPPTLFATFCAHNDKRPAQQLAADLAAARERYPEAFRRMVSVHVRTALNRRGRLKELDQPYLQAYDDIVELVIKQGS